MALARKKGGGGGWLKDSGVVVSFVLFSDTYIKRVLEVDFRCF